MSVTAATVGKTTAGLVMIALAAAGVTACGAARPQAQAPAAQAGRDVLTASVTLDSGGHAWQPGAGGTVLVSTDAGHRWSQVRLPGTPALGHSVVVSGQTIAAVTVHGTSLEYQHSTDGGASWHTTAVHTATPTDEASVALSSDGQRVAVLAVQPNTPGAGDLPELSTGPVAGPLVPVSAPASGDVAWAGQTLVLTGGPLASQLWTSGDNGAHWTQRAVDGPPAPRFNVSPTAPSFGVPSPGAGSSVTVPVTEHRGATSYVQLFTSANGARYVAGPRVALAGVLGAGVTALASPAGPGRWVAASPGSYQLHVIAGGTVTVIDAAGLSGTLESLTFSSARAGLAETTQGTCASKKAACHSTEALYRTSDGGRTWQRTTT